MSQTERVCLVTGARGFLGSYVVAEARSLGFRVSDLGRVRVPSSEIEGVVRSIRPSLVIHLAGPASVAASFTDPRRDFVGTVAGTACLLEALHIHAPRARFLYVSSAAVYGNADVLPISEDAVVRPISPYGYHKAMSECLVEEVARVFGMWAATARVFSAYGPGLRKQVVYDLCSKASRGVPLVLDGSGTESRDFIHGRDVARALMSIGARGSGSGEKYNVASGIETPISEMGRLVSSAFGLPAPSFSGSRRVGDPPRWRADISRLKAIGFECGVTLVDGVYEVANWVRNHDLE